MPAARALILCTTFLLTGCASVQTVYQTNAGSPKIYGGTRLDYHAVHRDRRYLDYAYWHYGLEAPRNPSLDMPFSLVLDTVMLPLTLPAEVTQRVLDHNWNDVAAERRP